MWVNVSDRLPPYGWWTILKTDDGKNGPGFRSHTDHRGEHFRTNYQFNNDSCDVLRPVIAWLEYPES